MSRKILVIVFLIIVVFGAVYFIRRSRVETSSGWSEAGREVVDFEKGVPPAFPESMPIERDPAHVVRSYAEFIAGDEKEGELRHAQYTYVYTSIKAGETIAAEFEKYLKDDGYTAEKTFSDDKLSYNLSGSKGDGVIANVTIAPRNQFENLVTISVIYVEKTLRSNEQ